MLYSRQLDLLKLKVFLAWLLVLFLLLPCTRASAERIKDLADIAGVRSNKLLGYGLVVGLDGTGDKTNQAPFTTQSFNSMLKQFGITIPAGARFNLKNVAAVMVHGEIPAFAKPGHKVDITVSSIADAKSLRGGTLLMTPMKGLDGKVYAVAQGNLIVGGFGAEGADGSKVTVNVPSVGRVPNGATVERAVPNDFASGQPIVFNLRRADFTTSKRMAEAINELLGPGVARPMDASSVIVDAPVNPAHRVNYLSLLENVDVKPGREAARIVINSRTGTIVVGQDVRVEPVAVTHGSLTVTVNESIQVSQPGPLGEGQTVVLPGTEEVNVEQDINPMFKLDGGSNLESIVRAVNLVGAAPGDLMAILEAMKQAGALKAEIIVI
ncbi:flagellar basal body P-ring protein FlgI [Pseudomaricurvus alkylphenolicus]|jgi:flagellar P-ring protein precursor FlgI|uniref:flagellar basal body P-ring protein FlgI n=1 Tax=Pseudomaricurvus alkylphenolicus TaxID=1306991 RepID=UPI00141F4CD9|nr:flagellar basal body P-ring protein FlgI [Pseudomaricurvus alkylphenolicus]NIB43253.1 flagellar basal body P-ring protein FlgI [Pseudomaricurvus alkylphenolicus]